MKTINNVSAILCDALKRNLKPGSKVSIVADSFSIFAYQQLKKSLDRVASVRFLFTSPTFVEADTTPNADQFAIMRRKLEQDLCNSEYELRPRNTLTQRELAKACKQWINTKVQFKANITTKRMPAFIIIDDTVYTGITGFTCTDLGCERGNEMFYNIQILDKIEGASLIAIFEQLWHDDANMLNVTPTVLDKISAICRDNDPDFIYFISIYHIFNEFIRSLDDHNANRNDFQNSRIW
ncbi:MAG: ATP-dependent helicase, partial [Proteobacteria bacterium]|nr:ATP-dependent helicase [Pseudomonadota bacterium]